MKRRMMPLSPLAIYFVSATRASTGEWDEAGFLKYRAARILIYIIGFGLCVLAWPNFRNRTRPADRRE